MVSATPEQQLDGWVFLEEGHLKGMEIVVDQVSNEVVSLSTRNCRDSDRWRHVMPSLEQYSALRVLDLENCRYIIELHDTVGSLRMLLRMLVTKCDRLERLPNSINCLQNLQEVGLVAVCTVF